MLRCLRFGPGRAAPTQPRQRPGCVDADDDLRHGSGLRGLATQARLHHASGVRATVKANVVLLVFFALELSDRVVRQEGRIFYWSTLLFLPAGLLFCGLLAAQRWAWWISRGAFALGALWFLLFLAVIPFAPMQGGGGPVPWYGRLDMAGATLAFASILACAYRSLGQSETRRYFGLLRTEE